MTSSARLIGIALATSLICSAASAVILYDGPTRNTTAPSGALLNSGWQYEGQWLGPTGSVGYLGTPIAAQYFITANHVGGTVGDTFVYNGSTYTTTDSHKDPDSDLIVWKISGSFPSWAPLYTNTNELNKPLVVIGRGTQRGSAVVVGSTTQGWQWGTQDGVQSWGQNTVSGTTSFTGYGPQLVFAFNPITGQNEGGLSAGDSGGGVFIQDAGVWKLAAINLGVDGPYNFSPTPTGSFNASMFDQTGLYSADLGWGPASGPANSYATRISSEAGWINGVIPEPSSLGIIAGLGLLLSRRSRAM